jgi:predicted nucleic acid-binding protein
MGQYLIDNNAISHFFSGLLTKEGMDFMAEVIDRKPTISVITEIEALSWVNKSKAKERILIEFVQDAQVLALTQEVVKECIRLKRSRKIKTPDAIIAATAIVHNLILITSDSGFLGIKDLEVVDPYLV